VDAGNESFAGIDPEFLATIPTDQNRFDVSKDIRLVTCTALRNFG
jgi:hypothetical protein